MYSPVVDGPHALVMIFGRRNQIVNIGSIFLKLNEMLFHRLWISGVNNPMGIIMASMKNHCFGDVY